MLKADMWRVTRVPMLSMMSGSPDRSVLGATPAASGWASRTAIISATAVGAYSTSQLDTSRYSPRAASTPRFTPPAKPVFRPSSISRASG